MRFEGNDRFYEVVLDGTTLHSRAGRIGTDGKANLPKVLATRDKAEKELQKRIAEQRTKGFVQVSVDLAPEPANPALERQIIEEPTDAGRCLVYADWLQNQGHPRGELGVLQSMRAARPDDEALAKAEQKLLEKHPELAPPRVTEAARKQRKAGALEEGYTSVRWENGFIAAARIARSTDKPPYTVRELVAELLAHPAARFLRELRIGPLGEGTENVFPYHEVIAEIVRGAPRTLRTLAIVDLPPGAAELAFSGLGDVSPLLAATPLLEELALAGQALVFATLALPKLRKLSVSTNDAGVVATLAKAELPRLEALHLECGESPLAQPALDKLLAAAWPLRHLAITRTGNTDALIPSIARAPMLEQLHTLDLSGGRLSDAGGSALHASGAAFAHLQRLDVSNNNLTAPVVARLAKLCAEVTVAPQRASNATALTDKDLARLAPDVDALAKGRALAKPALWKNVGRDDEVFYGSCKGSSGEYEVYVRVPSLENGCSCPSGKRPCKHAVGLAVLIAKGHVFPERAAPRGLFGRATSMRYYGGGE